MYKLSAMSLALVSLLACQPKLARQQGEHSVTLKNTEAEANLSSEFAPFTAGRLKQLQAVSTSGFSIDVSHYELPSHLLINAIDSSSRPTTGWDATDTNHSFPGELALHWQWTRGNLSVGRQALATPFLQTDHAQLVPNLFEAASATIKFSENLDISAYYIDTVSAWESGDDKIDYSSLGNSLAEQETGGAAILATEFNHTSINGQAWFFHLPDIENIGYLELSHFGELSNSVSYSLSTQIDWARATGSALLGEFGSATLGFKTDLSWSGYSVFAAYNQLVAGSSSTIAIGGDPYFTSLEYRSFTDIGSSNAYAYSAGVSYELAAMPLKIELSAGRFKGGGESNFDVREIDISLGYDLSREINIRMFFSSVSGQGHDSDDHRIAVGLTLPFK